MLKTTQLKQTEKQRYSTLLSQYSYGKNKFTVDDITVLANAMALGKPLHYRYRNTNPDSTFGNKRGMGMPIISTNPPWPISGTVSKNVGTTVSGACEERLYFELEGLKKAENKYLGTILLMLKG